MAYFDGQSLGLNILIKHRWIQAEVFLFNIKSELNVAMEHYCQILSIWAVENNMKTFFKNIFQKPGANGLRKRSMLDFNLWLDLPASVYAHHCSADARFL